LARRVLRPPHLAAGVILFALCFVPYALWEVQNGFANLAALRSLGSEPAGIDGEAVAAASWLVIPVSLEFIIYHFGTENYFFGAGLPWATPVNFLFAVLTAGGLIWLLRGLAGRGEAPARPAAYGLLVCWLVLPILFYLRHSRPVFSYYVLSLMPAPYLLIGGFLDTLAGWLRMRMGRGGALAILCGLTALPAFAGADLVLRSLAWLRDAPPNVTYGVPLRYSLQAVALAERIHRETGTTAPLYLAAPLPYDAALGYLLGLRTPYKAYRVADTLVYPTAGPATVLAMEPAGLAGPWLAAEATVAGRLAAPPARAFTVYRLAAARPPDLPGESWQPVAATWQNGVRLTGIQAPARLEAGMPLTVTLRWQPGPATTDTLRFFLHLTDPSGRTVAATDELGYPAEYWSPDEVVYARFTLSGSPAITAGRYTLRVGMYHLPGVTRIPLVEPAGRPGEPPATSIAVAEIIVRSAGPATTSIPSGSETRSVEAGLQDGLWLRHLYLAPAKPGQPLTVTLVWQAVAKPTQDYTIFVHLVDASGRLVTQHDSEPDEGRYPTSRWLLGEEVTDRHLLVLPAGLPAGRYYLLAGAYDRTTGTRLPRHDANGNTIDLGPLDLP
jgi:hypothetical protein